MKILYLSELKPNSHFGGSVVEDRNLRCLKKLFDVTEVGVYAQGRKPLRKFIDLFFSKVPTLYSRRDYKRIKSIICKSDADTLFLETSKMGYFAKIAKKKGMRVISYPVNCEAVLYATTRGKVFVPFIKKQEKLTISYSDFIIYLNERDRKEFYRRYPLSQKRASAIVPVTFADKVTERVLHQLRVEKDKSKGLFFGSNFPPNYNGIKWFVDNVAPMINADIDIVGLGFEGHQELERKNISVIGAVDNLQERIVNAGFVISPIFEGSGMKVKTCEALMYGKVIFASDEAVEGYDLDERSAFICNTKEEFASAINSFVANGASSTYNFEARKCFLEKYSDIVCEQNFLKIFHLFDDKLVA